MSASGQDTPLFDSLGAPDQAPAIYATGNPASAARPACLKNGTDRDGFERLDWPTVAVVGGVVGVSELISQG